MSDIIDIHIGNTAALLNLQFIQPTDDDPEAPFPLTGYDVEYYVCNKSGRVVLPQTNVGVTVTDADEGKFTVRLDSSVVDEACDYAFYAVAIDGSDRELTGPVKRQDFILRIHDN